MKGFDFEFSSQGNKATKAFLSKLQVERDQRLFQKQATASATWILAFYRRSKASEAATLNIAKDFLSKTNDIRRLEPVLKDKYPLMVAIAVEKYRLFTVSMLLDERNGERFEGLVRNLLGLWEFVGQNSRNSVSFAVFRKRLASAVIGMKIRGKLNAEIEELAIKNQEIFRGLRLKPKLIGNVLKNRGFYQGKWAEITRFLVGSVVKGNSEFKAQALRELLGKPCGVRILCPDTMRVGLEALIAEARALFLKKSCDLAILLGNLVDLASVFTQGPDGSWPQQVNDFLGFMEILTKVLDLVLVKNPETYTVASEEEKKAGFYMEIEDPAEPLSPQDLSIKALDFGTFFSKGVLSLSAAVFDLEIKRNFPIFRPSELIGVGTLARAYSLVLSINSSEKTRYLVSMSQSPIFLLKVLEIIEYFAQFPDLKNPQSTAFFSDILGFFARIYLQKIELMDDAEFFSLEIPGLEKGSYMQNFPIEKIEGLALFLVKFAFRAFYAENLRLDCKTPVISLLNSLFFRHCHRNFKANPKFWQIQEVANPASFMKDEEIYCELPFIFPFEARVQRFRDLLKNDQSLYRRDDFLELGSVSVRRGFELEDAIGEFSKKKLNWKDKIRVKYISDQGIEEIGIDGGGMFKEFIIILARQACDPVRGLFLETKNHTLTPNPDSRLLLGARDTEFYEFVGKVIGKAVYEEVLIDSVFENTFLKTVIGQICEFNDLLGTDPDLYKNLLYLKHCGRDSEISGFGMYFCLTMDSIAGPRSVELKPNGEKIPVSQ